MDFIDRLRKLFEYDHWANCRALVSIEMAGEVIEPALRLLGHVIGAQQVWLARLAQADTSSLRPWANLSRDQCGEAIEGVYQSWKSSLGKLTPSHLNDDVIYRNTLGREFRTPVVDVLEHVVAHSAYHRGQIAVVVRQAGGKPAVTDYVAYVREQ